MNTTIGLAIPQVTDQGTVAIPFKDWKPVVLAVEQDFEGEISIHVHDKPGAYHGWSEVPTSHYLLEISIDEERVKELIQAIDPLIKDIVTRNTTETFVPAPVS